MDDFKNPANFKKKEDAVASFDSVVTAMETMNSELKLDFVKTRLLDFQLKQESKSKEDDKDEEVTVQESNSEDSVAFIAVDENHALNSQHVDKKINFFLDSGASDHMVSSELEVYMSEVKMLERPISISIAFNGKCLMATKKGRIRIKHLKTEVSLEALLVPNLSANLISVNQLTRKGLVNFGQALKTNNVDLTLWHRRMGHLNRRSLQRMKLPVSDEVCSECQKGKATRLPFISCKLPRSNRIGELIHTDLCGPIDPPTRNGERYFQVIVDDYSHFTKVYLLKQKNEATKNVINYVNSIEAQHGTRVFKIRCDNGGEFLNKTLLNFTTQKGILLQTTVPYTSQQNGVSERMNRTLMDKARCMISDSDLSKEMWGYAVLSAAYLLNRSPTNALNGETPSDRWFGETDLSKIRIFGCKLWYSILPKRGKLDDRAAEGRLVGYMDNGYRVFDVKTKVVHVARDIVFHESNKSFNDEKLIPDYFDLLKNESEGGKSANDVKSIPDYFDLLKNESEENVIPEEENEHCVEKFYDAENDIQENELRQSSRVKKKPVRFGFDEYETYEACCMFISGDPVTYEDAIQSEEWTDAIKKELDAHEKMKTWEECDDVPKEYCPIDTKWVFRTKENNVKKARLVAKGYQEKIEEQIYSPVARLSTCNGASTPLEPNFIVTREDEMEIVDVPYRELIGSLMYVSMGSRPDITFAVSYLSRYLDKPNKKVWVAAKRVLRYLRATQSMSMVYEKTENMQLIGYSDSDWAADPTDRKSVTGSVIFFCGNPVAWFSKKQNCVTLSSTEVEYVAGSLVSAELIALKGIVKDLTNQHVDTVLLMDNQGAIKISQNYENSKRSKHIDVKYHFLKDSIQKKLIIIQYVDTKKNTADIMTKALGRCIFSIHLVSLKLIASDNYP
ncbi:hypothetical protein WDU94_009805 [Cyamophila willieti]